MNSVYDYIINESNKNTLQFSLIDPDEVHQTPEEAGLMSYYAERAGSDAILIGGSTAGNKNYINDTVKEVKYRVSIPVIIFPGNPAHVSNEADALLYMSVHNSTNPFFITGVQAVSARKVKESGLEVIPTSYLIAEPGGTAGRLSKASLLPRSKPRRTLDYALSAELLGCKLVYLESGSGVDSQPPYELIKRTADGINIPLIYGGGVKNAEHASKVAESGADIIVLGSILEDTILEDEGETLEELIKSIKE